MTDLSNSCSEPAAAAADDSAPTALRNSALALIDEGNALEEQGSLVEAMARYDAAVQADPRCARAHLNRGNVLLADTHIDEARVAYQQAIACDPSYAAAHFNLGNLNCRVGDYERAIGNYQLACNINPNFADAFVAMANVFDRLGRPSEATQCYERALAINPAYAEVHFNLGLLQAAAGQHEGAASSLRRAIELRPDFGAAHYALGKVWIGMARLDMAETSLRQALSVMPDSEAVVADLAMVLQLTSRSPEAVGLTLSSLERAPTAIIKKAFANAIARTRFVIDDPLARTALTVAITEPWAVPYELCRPALSLLALDPAIANCIRLVNSKWPARASRAELLAAGLTRFSDNSLLHAVLEVAPVSTVEFERLLTVARHALLEAAVGERSPDPADIAATRFYAALARQCFINEYIFDCDEGERAGAVICRTRLLALLEAKAEVPPLLLLAVAAFFPLYALPKPERLLAADLPGPIDDVLRQQVREPLEEQSLYPAIERLTLISEGVSERVREQYESNPYPRWVKVPVGRPTLSFNHWLRRTFPRSRFTPMPDDSQPEMLIAGCGTGSQPILTVQRFRGARVLAVDLSISSIAYALRKTRQLGVTNVEYAQADILKLGTIARTFDIIASVGVLHHLADPFNGWRTLLSRLRPGGFMQLGFYSELARNQVVAAREFIAARGYASTAEDIRRFRRDLDAQNATGELEELTQIPDFYSTSECRDLVFHVQEHRLTLPQIDLFLSESGLQFLGFELDPTLSHQYRTRFSDDPAGTNLRNWTLFEEENPRTFLGMYQFWIQRPANQ